MPFRASVRFASIAVVAVAAACHPLALPAAIQGTAAPQVARPSPGRATIVGVVADSTTGYPVVGASVYFTADSVIGVGTARPRTDLPRATTDRRGGFSLRDVPSGRYTIAFSDLDHFPMRRIVVLQADETRTEIFRPARRAHP
jgi:hypothetical protein